MDQGAHPEPPQPSRQPGSRSTSLPLEIQGPGQHLLGGQDSDQQFGHRCRVHRRASRRRTSADQVARYPGEGTGGRGSAIQRHDARHCHAECYGISPLLIPSLRRASTVCSTVSLEVSSHQPVSTRFARRSASMWSNR